MNLTHGALFYGVHGFSLASRWAGIPTLWGSEKEPYLRDLSKQNFPDLIDFGDIRSMLNEEEIPFVSIVSAGIPCQPFSLAGKRLGKVDHRFLWEETLEIIKRVRPNWFIFENVSNVKNMVLDDILSDLEENHYSWQAFDIPAAAVFAPHRRYRLWVIAYSELRGRETGSREAGRETGHDAQGCSGQTRSSLADTKQAGLEGASIEKMASAGVSSESCKNVPHSDERRKPLRRHDAGMGGQLQPVQDDSHSDETGFPIDVNAGGLRETHGKIAGDKRLEFDGICADLWSDWAVEPGVGRVVDGFPGRVDQLKGLGEAVVPQIPFVFFSYIRMIEEGMQCK